MAEAENLIPSIHIHVDQQVTIDSVTGREDVEDATVATEITGFDVEGDAYVLRGALSFSGFLRQAEDDAGDEAIPDALDDGDVFATGDVEDASILPLHHRLPFILQVPVAAQLEHQRRDGILDVNPKIGQWNVHVLGEQTVHLRAELVIQGLSGQEGYVFRCGSQEEGVSAAKLDQLLDQEESRSYLPPEGEEPAAFEAPFEPEWSVEEGSAFVEMRGHQGEEREEASEDDWIIESATEEQAGETYEAAEDALADAREVFFVADQERRGDDGGDDEDDDEDDEEIVFTPDPNLVFPAQPSSLWAQQLQETDRAFGGVNEQPPVFKPFEMQPPFAQFNAESPAPNVQIPFAPFSSIEARHSEQPEQPPTSPFPGLPAFPHVPELPEFPTAFVAEAFRSEEAPQPEVVQPEAMYPEPVVEDVRVQETVVEEYADDDEDAFVLEEETVSFQEETVRFEEETVRFQEETVGFEEETVRSEEEPVSSEEEPVRSEEEPVRSEEEPVRSEDVESEAEVDIVETVVEETVVEKTAFEGAVFEAQTADAEEERPLVTEFVFEDEVTESESTTLVTGIAAVQVIEPPTAKPTGPKLSVGGKTAAPVEEPIKLSALLGDSRSRTESASQASQEVEAVEAVQARESSSHHLSHEHHESSSHKQHESSSHHHDYQHHESSSHHHDHHSHHEHHDTVDLTVESLSVTQVAMEMAHESSSSHGDSAKVYTSQDGHDDHESIWADIHLGESEHKVTMKFRIIHEQVSLSHVAEQYNTSIQDLVRANNLEHQELEEGQILYIPVRN